MKTTDRAKSPVLFRRQSIGLLAALLFVGHVASGCADGPNPIYEHPVSSNDKDNSFPPNPKPTNRPTNGTVTADPT